MARIWGLLAVCGGVLLLAGCVGTPQPVLEAYDACDRQTEACYDLCLLEESREEGAACDNRCDAEADQCFARVTETGLRNYPEWEPDQDYRFYARTGLWSRLYGWRPGPHGQPYSYTRPYERDRYYYDRRFYDPYYDSWNDCYGYRRAPWCRNYDWYRDRYRDRYWPDRGSPRPNPRPDPTEPQPPTAKPVPLTPSTDRNTTVVPMRPAPEPERAGPDQSAPEPRRTESPRPVFEPLIPPTRSEPPARSTPVPKPQPAKPQPTQRTEPSRSTPSPVRSEPVARPSTPAPRPEPAPAKPAPQPAPKPSNQDAPNKE